MRPLYRGLVVLLQAVAAAVGLGLVGMMCGSAVARAINPRPNPHLMEGLECAAGGAMIGGVLGVLGVAAAAWRRRQRIVKSPGEPSL